MIRSMTGFGRGEASQDGKRFTVEVKTVNHRFFEPNIRLSRKIAAFENDLRGLLASYISRGKADVYVTYEFDKGETQLQVHEDMLETYLRVLRDLGQRYQMKDDLEISTILKLPDVLEHTDVPMDQETIWPLLEEAARAALQQLNAMREAEGQRIQADLLAKADHMEEIVEGLMEHAPQIEREYRERLLLRVQELTEGRITLDAGMLETEVILFADKSCIDEELVRLKSHIEQLRTLLSAEEPVGRPLDFLMQEFNREANTIAWKAGDLAVTQKALELKKEIEKIREQIQNIE